MNRRNAVRETSLNALRKSHLMPTHLGWSVSAVRTVFAKIAVPSRTPTPRQLDRTEQMLADGAAEDVDGEADGEAAEARSRADGAMPAVGLLRAEHARTEEVWA